jgi:uncharacterized protein YerC
MPHISKRELSKRQFQMLYREFVRSIQNLRSESAKNDFLWQFLTPTEKIMFSKRFAMILLLERGESTYRICKMLDVSPSTIDRIARKWDRGGYSKVVSKTRRDSDALEDFINWLNTVGGLMPPYVRIGKKRNRY